MSSLARRRHRPRATVPDALPFELSRPALLARLDADARFIFLIAPSGFGKTTLLADWARQDRGRHVWLQLTDDDQEPETLLKSLVRAALSSGMILPYCSALPQSSSRGLWLRTLLEDFNASTEDVTLIIDRGELLSEDAALTLSNMFRGLGEGHRGLIGQHDGSHLSPSPFLAAGHTQVINADELSLSLNETQTLALSFSGISSTQSAQIYEENAGWPLGIVLALHQPLVGHLTSPAEVFDCMVSRLPAVLRDCIAQLAVLENWSEEEVQRAQLTLQPGWLRAVLRSGLPLTVRSGRVVPHELVRKYLDQRLRFHPQQYRALHLARAQQEQAQERPYSAIRHYLLAEHPALAIELAETLGPRWRGTKNWILVVDTLSALPKARLSPTLLALLGLAYFETGQTMLVTSLLTTQTQADQEVALSFIVRARLAEQQGRLTDALHHVRRGLELATQQRDTLQLLQLRARIQSIQGQRDAALADAQQAVQQASHLGDANLRVETLGTLGGVYSRLGHFEEAIATIELAVEAGIQSGYVNRILGEINYLKNQYLLTGRYQQADVLLRRYLEAARIHSPRGVLAGEMALGHLLFIQDQGAEARVLLQTSFDAFFAQENYLSASKAFNPLLDLLLEAGEPEYARRLWRQLYGFLVVEHDPWEQVNKLNSEALLFHAEGKLKQAEIHASRAVGLAATVSPVKLFQTELLLLDLKRSAGTLCQHDLVSLSACYEADPDYYLDVLQTWRIYVALLEYSEACHWTIPIFRLVTERQEREQRADVARPCLRIETLMESRVLLDGVPLPFSSRAHEEILAYLALNAQAPGLLQQDEIALAVWEYGSSDVKRARRSLQTARSTINRTARSVLPVELIESGGRGRRNTIWRLSPIIRVECDALELLQVTDPVQAAKLATYTEAFLLNRHSEWVLGFRQQLVSHLADVLAQGALEIELRDARTALQWLIHAANLARSPESFAAIQKFRSRQEDARLLDSAAHVLRQAAEGLPLTLNHLSLN